MSVVALHELIIRIETSVGVWEFLNLRNWRCNSTLRKGKFRNLELGGCDCASLFEFWI